MMTEKAPRLNIGAVKALPADFGHGTMTANARDMFKIALLAGFDAKVLALKIFSKHRGQGLINAATVERVMEELDLEQNPDHSIPKEV